MNGETMMQITKVVTAIDSFKGSLTSLEAGDAVKRGFQKVDPGVEVIVRPLADGGEGTVDALVSGLNGDYETVMVTGPIGEAVVCSYGYIKESKTAVLEMSGAAGILLVPEEKRNPMNTTTYGLGELIRDAIGKGCRNFAIGLGGSATNDGGIGMLQALGFGFYDNEGNPIPLGARGIEKLAFITNDTAMPELEECTFHIACDVINPLYGKSGASVIYGPQKGADSAMVETLDKLLRKYAVLAKNINPAADPNAPGSGAAGGLGFGFSAFLNAKLESGISVVLKATKLEDDIREADLVVTGEGHMDAQTSMGKAPIGVAEIAAKYKKPVIAFAGGVTRDATKCNEKGIDAFFPIVRDVTDLEEAMEKENAMKNLEDTAEQVFRLIRMDSKMN